MRETFRKLEANQERMVGLLQQQIVFSSAPCLANTNHQSMASQVTTVSNSPEPVPAAELIRASTPTPLPIFLTPTFESNQNICLTDYLSLSDIDSFAKKAPTRSAFAVRLLEVVFTNTDEIVNKNVRGVKNKSALDPRRIAWVKFAVSVKFPFSSSSDWQECVVIIDAWARRITQNVSSGRTYDYIVLIKKLQLMPLPRPDTGLNTTG